MNGKVGFQPGVPLKMNQINVSPLSERKSLLLHILKAILGTYVLINSRRMSLNVQIFGWIVARRRTALSHHGNQQLLKSTAVDGMAGARAERTFQW